MFGVMVANVLHRRAHVRQASMEKMSSLLSICALGRWASMLIRMKNIAKSHSFERRGFLLGVRHGTLAKNQIFRIRVLEGAVASKRLFERARSHICWGSHLFGVTTNDHGHGYGNFRAPWHPGVDMLQIETASMDKNAQGAFTTAGIDANKNEIT